MDTMDYVTWNTDHKWSDPSFEGEDNSKEKIQPVSIRKIKEDQMPQESKYE